ncbi:MAG: hypothetical protein ACI8QC_000710 [Planctomycetota bacterium]|jgi:hypothetical protein
MPNFHVKRGLLFGALLSLCAAAGCSSVPLTSHNLDALLDGNGNLRHQAAVLSPWRYNLNALTNTSWLATSDIFSTKRRIQVGDPSYEALKFLLELQDPPKGSTRPHYQQMEQVRQFARFAAMCPGRLTRERALLGLVPHGQRLKVQGPAAPPQEAANAPELRTALLGLVQAARPMLVAEGRKDATRRRDLAAAADLFGELQLDMEGGWRALRSLAILAAGVDLERPELEPLKTLSLKLQHHMVAMALHSGLRDPDPYVRAAGARVAHTLFGEPFLDTLLQSISGQPVNGESFGFSLQGENASDPEVLIAAFELVREHGLPVRVGLSAKDARGLRLEQMGLLIQVVHESQGLDDRTRTGAMLALTSVLPDVGAGLRKENWLAWWDDWAQSELTALRAEQPSPESGN